MSPAHQVLIIGAGSIGERHLRCFLATGRADVGFVETRPDLAEQIAQRYPNASSFPTLESALSRSWNAAVIATPAPLHIPQAIELLQRDISVLIEKPLSVTLDGVDQLLAAAKASRGVAGVAYIHRANPITTEMRQALLSKRFGKPVELVAVCGQHFPTYRPAYDKIYYTDRKLGGGAVQDALTHIVNLGEWLVGPVDRVVADLEHLVLPRVKVEDTVHVLARHGDVMASYALNQHQAPNELTVTVLCERGAVRFENHRTRWRWMEEPESPWTDSAPLLLERDTLFTRQANAFLDAVEGKTEPLCQLEEGVSTLRANLAILESAQSQAWRSTTARGA
ncbi:Gfo/Idh/MocA family protein [Planctomicrobium sp. SH661]|uniref:Gfo/Idh/MocA family protein n=1 Tax=Planctomicrobium sp. SH661 TaxID=3448124 RepID=UPI003F5C7FC6